MGGGKLEVDSEHLNYPDSEPVAIVKVREHFRELYGNQVVRGTFWTLFGYGVSQVLRLGGNLILTRLLFPEAFGLMALISMFMIAAEMFSDVGIGPSIIQNKRGNDPVFLNTAWTIQSIRGFFLWMALCILAWPMSQFYEEKLIAVMLPVVGFNMLLGGLNTTAFFTLNRRLELARITLVDLGCQIGGHVAMVLWAWIYPTVWALVFGGVFATTLKLLAGHIFLPAQTKHRFHFDRECMRSLFRFGRWIFLSTIFGFFAGQGDRVILGKVLTLAQLGVYSIASMLADGVISALESLASKVLFPLYSRLAEGDPAEMQHKIGKLRLKLLLATLLPICLIIAGGDHLIAFMYDHRYHNAGWMLQILSIGALAASVNIMIAPIVISHGDSFGFMITVFLSAFTLLLCMFIGGFLWGSFGLVLGITVSSFAYYPVMAYFAYRYRIWTPVMDFTYIAGGGILSLTGWILLH